MGSDQKCTSKFREEAVIEGGGSVRSRLLGEALGSSKPAYHGAKRLPKTMLGLQRHRPNNHYEKVSIDFRKAFGVAALLLAAALPLRSIADVVALPSFDVDINQTSVSGLSAGGFMAVQFAVAYSSNVKGAGIIAGGPYYCAQSDVGIATTVCSCTGLFAAFCSPVNGGTDIPTLIKITDQNVGNGAIDDTVNLAKQKIFLFSGKIDSIVPQPVMNDLQAYYRHYTSPSNISYHICPVDFKAICL